MLISVVGSTGPGRIAGIRAGDPASLLRVVAEYPDQLVILLAPRYAARTAREQADLVTAARPRARLEVMITEHHALTLTLVAHRVLQILDRTGAEDARASIDQGLRTARSLVWCSAAWGLRGAGLTLGQRLRSLGGGSGCVVELGRPAGITTTRVGWQPRSGDRLYTVDPAPRSLITAWPDGSAPELVSTRIEAAPYAARSSLLLTALPAGVNLTGHWPPATDGSRTTAPGAAFPSPPVPEEGEAA